MINETSAKRHVEILCQRSRGGKLRCLACARRCRINRGDKGFCKVRMNADGKLFMTNYGRIVAAHVDTIEKKPIYHYRPGSKLLSIGTVGCNWSCDFCLNYHVSQTDQPAGQKITPEEIIRLAKQYECQGIAYTYNEPLVFIEFARDIGILAHREGLFNVVVTNGYGTSKVVAALSEFADCVAVGLKANASSSFLKKHAKTPSLRAVFRTLKDLKRRKNLHIEISDLILGQGGDSLRQARILSRWIRREMGPDIPLHLVRFYPSYKMTGLPPTPSSTLEAHYKIARQAGLNYVYIANLPGHERENTYCPNCGNIIIRRYAYEVHAWNLDGKNRCRTCGHAIPIIEGLTEVPSEERYVPVIFPPMDMLYVCEGLSG